MAGLQNQPLGVDHTMGSEGPDPMTMRTVGMSQTFPYPGKLAWRTRVAERDVDAALAAADQRRLDVVRDVRVGYYELAYLDAALRVVDENRALVTDVIRVTDAHYTAGTGTQQDVLKARFDAAQLGQAANALREQRRAQLAALNGLLDRPSDAPIDSAAVPRRIVRAAVSDSASQIRFESETFGAAAAGSPIPALSALQEMAIEHSPMLREHEARIAAQGARVGSARKEAKPDIDVSLQYGQRSDRPDMVTALVSIPLPLQHRRKQDEDVAAASAELTALEAEHDSQLNELRASVARLYTELERQRTQLALDVRAILPTGRAALSAATANYQTGKTDLLAVLDSRSALFAFETSYYRAVADFAKTLAELDAAVGVEVLP
jgi:outer membrane protein TolC